MTEKTEKTAEAEPTNRNQTDVNELLNHPDRALAWPALCLVSMILPWAKVTGLLNQSATGFDMDIAPLMLVLIVAVGASWFYNGGEYRRPGWLLGGGSLTAVSLLTLSHINSQIGEFNQEMQGNLFAGAVNIEIGVGMYLALASSVAILVVGYRLDGKSLRELAEQRKKPRDSSKAD